MEVAPSGEPAAWSQLLQAVSSGDGAVRLYGREGAGKRWLTALAEQVWQQDDGAVVAVGRAAEVGGLVAALRDLQAQGEPVADALAACGAG